MSTDRATNVAAPTPAAPSETIAPALRRRLQQLYDHGMKLMEKDKYDFDYAHTVFAECIVQDPNNLVYVESFLLNLSRKYDNNKKGARFGLGGGKGAFKKAFSKKDWREVLRTGPDVLKTNPWDIPTLRALAEACAALDYREVELRYLKNALEAAPKDAASAIEACALEAYDVGFADGRRAERDAWIAELRPLLERNGCDCDELTESVDFELCLACRVQNVVNARAIATRGSK